MKKDALAVAFLMAGAAAVLFIALNAPAYRGYFQDDDLDTLTWAVGVRANYYLTTLSSPLFAKDNFRPAAHLYYTLMGQTFGLHFPPWVAPLWVIHFLNSTLLFLILRRMDVETRRAAGAAAFFLLSTAAINVYWKPMYIFDLLCTAFCLASLLAYMHRRYVLSFAAFWLAYKSKELAVMLPAVLVLYEYWIGEKRYLRLTPFLLVSLSFGLQGIFLNQNVDNAYTFRFTTAALSQTLPFYLKRILTVPFAGFALPLLVLVRDRRIWFGLAAALLVSIPLLFLPGRMSDAYLYLPLAFISVALAAAACHGQPALLAAALLLWIPFDYRELRHQKAAVLLNDGHYRAFVTTLLNWGAEHPGLDPLVYDSVPNYFHSWGVEAAWQIAHKRQRGEAYWADSAQARTAVATRTVVLGTWTDEQGLKLRFHEPTGKPVTPDSAPPQR